MRPLGDSAEKGGSRRSIAIVGGGFAPGRASRIYGASALFFKFLKLFEVPQEFLHNLVGCIGASSFVLRTSALLCSAPDHLAALIRNQTHGERLRGLGSISVARMARRAIRCSSAGEEETRVFPLQDLESERWLPVGGTAPAF